MMCHPDNLAITWDEELLLPDDPDGDPIIGYLLTISCPVHGEVAGAIYDPHSGELDTSADRCGILSDACSAIRDYIEASGWPEPPAGRGR